MKSNHPGERAGISSAGERVSESWERRLQRVRMRTKIVVPMVALAVGPALAIGTFMILRARESVQASVVSRVEFDTASKARAVQAFLAGVQQDIRFLSQTKPIRDLVSVDAARDAPVFGALRAEAERNLLYFQRGHPYCQAQCLSPLGQQLIRLDAKGEMLQVMAPQQLEDLSEQSYVKAASALEPGQVYVGPMHLDVIHGMVGAVLKYATPVSGDDGRIRSLLVVGVCAEHILSQIGPLPAGMEAWLADQTGIYLGYAGEWRDKRTVFSLEKKRPLSADYSTEQITALLHNQRKPLAIKTADTLIFSAPIALRADGSALNWTLLISYPRAPIEAPIWRLTVFLSIVMVLVVAMAGSLGILITHYLARPVASLRHATREIAAGDLSKRVEITTGDEIEALAADFNLMTERLSEAQARLAQWNVELEREVAQQTERVRQLQTGLARADKLAAIGQITAGVMHEIGNPLAAIKTKIQVAEEAGDLSLDQQALLKEILVEVDRLAAFLRSFSRLARLRDHPAKGAVLLTDVADGVISLLAPDLRRRRAVLQCVRSDHVPEIWGDADQLRHLLMNLILNAADASPAGGKVLVKIERRVAASDKGAVQVQASLVVVDHGTGIGPEVLEKIWNPFFTTKPEGTGLGLAISRQIVQEHGGTIQIQSEPGSGTKVTAVFPEFNPDTATAEPKGRESQQGSVPPRAP